MGICAGLFLGCGTAAATDYSYVPVTAAHLDSFGLGMNKKNQAVAATDETTDPRTFAIANPDGSAFGLDGPSGNSVAGMVGVNDSGVAAGTEILPSGETRPFTYSLKSGKYKKYSPGEKFAYATAINNNGSIVGYEYAPGGKQHGFLIDGGVASEFDVPGATEATNPSDIADDGTIVGTYGDVQGRHGFELKAGVFTTFDPPGTGTAIFSVNGISPSGVVAGSYSDGSGLISGFTLASGTFQTYQFPGAVSTVVLRAVSRQQILGNYSNGSTYHGFDYLGGVYFNIDFPGASDTNLEGTNRFGNFSGSYPDANDNLHSFVATCPQGQSPCRQ